MANPLQPALENAVKALQQWYAPAADSYASTTGLYHWDDPNLVADVAGDGDHTLGDIETQLMNTYGYADAYQDTSRWWNSANAITALIDYMLITKDHQYLWAIDNTFNKAPNAFDVSVEGVEVGAAVGAAAGAAYGAQDGFALAGPIGAVAGGAIGAVVGFFGGGGAAAATIARTPMKNFLNKLHDDAGWWALAWIKAYDLTGEKKYLAQAQTIFNDMVSGWDNRCGGGIYWATNGTDDPQSGNGKGPYKNSIANELFLAVAASLYGRLASDPNSRSYLDHANQEWNWFQHSGLININNQINDSFGKTYDPHGNTTGYSCTNDQSTDVWTYNQGVILGALCELYAAPQLIAGSDPQLLDAAERIADPLIQSPYRSIVGAGESQIGDNSTASAPFVMAHPLGLYGVLLDYVYFRAIDNKLCKVNFDGSRLSQVGNNTTASTPFAVSHATDYWQTLWLHQEIYDWVYFRGTNNQLYRVRTDGSQQSQIGNMTSASMPFVVVQGTDDWVYCQGVDNKLWRVKYDGSQQSNIGNNTTWSTPFVTSHGGEGWVYFRGTNNKLYRVKYDGSQQSQIGNADIASMPFVMPHGAVDWVYFQGTDNNLYRVKYDGSQQTKIGSNTVSAPHVMAAIDGSDWIYYRGTDNKLYKVKYDGTQLSQVGSGMAASAPFVSASGLMYYQGTDSKLSKIFLGAAGPSASGVDQHGRGVLTEFNDDDPNAGIDNKNFKGIFMRNLGYLYKLRPRARYRAFILNNANYMVTHAHNPGNPGQYGGNWSGPFDGADFVRQTAAVDLLNAANVVPPQQDYTSLKQFLNDSAISLSTPLRPILNGAGSLRSVMQT